MKQIHKVAIVYGCLYPLNFLMAYILGQGNYLIGGGLMVLAIFFETLNVYYWIGAQTEDINGARR
jgi:hypothetical protein